MNSNRTIWLFGVVAVVLLLGGAAGWTQALQTQTNLRQEQSSIVAFAATATAASNAAANILATQSRNYTLSQGELATAEASNAALEAEHDALQSSYATVEVMVTDARQQYATAQARVGDLATDLALLRSRLSDFEMAAQCSNKPSQPINYSGNSAVSASLKQWLEDTEGSIEETEWDTVWSNSKVTIHKLTGEFLWVYIVYFKDDNLNYPKNRTFDLGAMCWLDY